ncbi:MAG TPA: RDD family protein [Vicinamibacterales bacterium]|nr:RDD family protein [Vicinamibacterales bacterium]
MTNPYAPPQAVVEDIPAPDGQFEPAERITRLGAAILDGLIFATMVYLPFIFAAVAIPLATAPIEGEETAVNAVMGGAGLIAFVGFAVWCWLTITYMHRNGQSIAKKLLGIKVVRSDGSPASLGRLIWLRNVLNWFISIVPLYGVVDSLFIFGEAHQCLHDKIADTIVVKA